MIAIDDILSAWARERPDVDASPMATAGRLSRVAARLDSLLADDYAQWKLDAGSFDVLFTLVRSGAPYSLSPTELAASSMVTTAAVAQRLNRLEAAGLVHREPNPGDGRGRIVTLTSDGKALANRALPSHLAAEERFLAALDTAQRIQLNGLLDQLLSNLQLRP
jgi:DNA-binding MarR family transcriptional regulator